MIDVTRREVLFTAVTAAMGLGLRRLAFAAPRATAATAAQAGAADYRDWRDLYREKWTWDRVARGTHTSANCVAACAWNLFVKDGVVWREEQSAPYVASNDTVPDWNPRGCQKGACGGDLFLGPTRISHPLRRVGPRGAGRWKRISWDEALGEIAQHVVDTLVTRGGEGVICEYGGNMDFGPTMASILRFFSLIGAPVTDPTAYVGDLPVGATITLGAGNTGGSSDDWFRSSYLVLWAFNPSATRIPDAHYLHEARYRGARVVTIAPDLNQSALHTDLWISPRPGTDAALALAACRLVIDEGLHAEDYLREQTDLPFLVREDTRRFLRESDVIKSGREDRFALWDETAHALRWAPGTGLGTKESLALPSGVKPALERRAEVKLFSGETVGVRTVFSLLRERLAPFDLEAASRITGVAPGVIRRFALDFAKSPASLILSSYGSCKNYHTDLLQRAQILLASLTGNLGRAGGGWRSGAFVTLEGVGLVGMQEKLGILDLIWLGVRSYMDPGAVERDFLSTYISSSLFHAVHTGAGPARVASEHQDPNLPRPASEYLREAIEKGHFPIGPAMDSDPPDVIVSVCGNVLRSSRLGDRIRDTMFARARLVVDVGFRMSETARYSDIVLPAAGWYEKVGLKYLVSLVPYVTFSDRAVDPVGDSKSEWEMFYRLASAVAAEAKRRGVSEVSSHRGKKVDIASLEERFGDRGRFGPTDDEKVLQSILQISAASRGISVEDLRREGGAVRIGGLGPQGSTAGMYTEYRVDEPIVPLRDFVEKKRAYPTLTGRQQFYVDHPWFLELDEALPTYKEPPKAGGDHPFTLTGGHTRWSIHSIWRDHPAMLRLQRGEPVVYLNTAVARERGIADHDWVRISNDLGDFVARAKLTGAIHPQQVHIFHAWEPFQFRGGRSHQMVAPSPIKPTQLVGDYGHLHWAPSHYEPNGADRDTRVDIEKVA